MMKQAPQQRAMCGNAFPAQRDDCGPLHLSRRAAEYLGQHVGRRLRTQQALQDCRVRTASSRSGGPLIGPLPA